MLQNIPNCLKKGGWTVTDMTVLPFIGNWLWESPKYNDGSVGVSENIWAAHDVFSFRFFENGVYIK